MSLASSLGKAANKLVTKFGGTVTLRTVTPGEYNPETGLSGEFTSDASIRGVLQDVTRREVNDIVQAGDKRLLIAANAVAVKPTPADRVIISGRELQVVQVTTIEQDNQPITYELLLRD
jgi:hypothetical protein